MKSIIEILVNASSNKIEDTNIENTIQIYLFRQLRIQTLENFFTNFIKIYSSRFILVTVSYQ